MILFYAEALNISFLPTSQSMLQSSRNQENCTLKWYSGSKLARDLLTVTSKTRLLVFRRAVLELQGLNLATGPLLLLVLFNQMANQDDLHSMNVVYALYYNGFLKCKMGTGNKSRLRVAMARDSLHIFFTKIKKY